MRIPGIFRALLGLRPERLQVAALCLRGEGSAQEVLLVTSRGRKRWILPKGWPMAGHDLPGSAVQEAWEEAGVRGKADPVAIGSYHYAKILAENFGQPVKTCVFRLRDIRLEDDFPEAGQRERRWWPLADAAAVVEEPELSALLRQLAP